MKPPVAKKIRTTFKNFNDVRHDDYYWMNEKTNPDVIAHLEAENAYLNEVMTPLRSQQQALFDAMVERIPAEEVQVAVQNGPYFYYTRHEKQLQYAIHARKRASSRDALETAEEEIVLDVNALASEDDYLHITEIRLTDDHRYVAYLENRDGTDSYTLFIKDLQTNELLDDVIGDVYISESVEWSSCGRYIFYVKIDDVQRPYQLWRHEIGTLTSADTLIYEETDVTFSLYVMKSQSSAYIFVVSQSTTTTEYRVLAANTPLEEPRLVAKRQSAIEYYMEHWENQFIILTNENAMNFTLKSCPVDDLSNITTIVPYDETYFLQGIYPFQSKLYITGRSNGLEQVFYVENNALHTITWDEPIYSVNIVGHQSYDASEVLVQYESFVTPKTTYRLDIATNSMSVVQQNAITGEYDASLYAQQQVWATASDGVKVPVLVHYRKDVHANGPAPLVLDAYGSYGYSSDPFFSVYRLPLLDRGVVFAIAQVRGGSEMGRTWYFDGKLKHKMNTFMDYIAAADVLVEQQWTTNEQLIGRGGSAGGLLIGAVANLAGDKFKVLVPEVAFVDVMTTMLDDTIPLTTSEYDEWGNPNNEDDYYTMRAYSPYENVEAKSYPHMFVTAGLNDPRVGYFEPAKWVARLRELKTDDHTLVFKTYMGAGHYGASGRINQLKELAELYAFVLHKVQLH